MRRGKNTFWYQLRNLFEPPGSYRSLMWARSTRKSFPCITKRFLSRAIRYTLFAGSELGNGNWRIFVADSVVPEAESRYRSTVVRCRWFREEIARSCAAWSIRANDDNDNHINNDNAGRARNNDNHEYKMRLRSGSIWLYSNYCTVIFLGNT